VGAARAIEERERTGSVLTAAPERADEMFLEGPRSRFGELITLLRVVRDFLRGFRVLHFVVPCVTIFGSARIKIDNPYYELARKMGDFIEKMAKTGMIGSEDLNLIYATDSVEDAIAHIRRNAIEPFGLKLVTRLRRHFPWLGERGISIQSASDK